MRKSIFAFAACVAFAGFATAVGAQERVYDNGPLWDVASIQTKPGHFNDYMKFVSTTWRAEQEQLKKDGYVLDYKVFNIVDARDNEPDVILAVEYKNMAAYDLPLDKQDALTKKLFGSMGGGDKAAIDRESFRTLRGDTLMRELSFK
ncbi:MAG: hypothetical protein WAK91_05705 [Candidatus Acidiferrales bacterium]